MIKKIIILMLMFIFSLSLFDPSVYASTSLKSEPAANTGGLWHEVDENRVYIDMRYTDIYSGMVFETGVIPSYSADHSDKDLSKFIYWETAYNGFDFSNTVTPKMAMISNPNPSIYNKFVIEIVPHMTGENEITTKTFAIYDETVNDIRIDIHDRDESSIPGVWDWFTLDIDGEEVLSSKFISDSQATSTEPANPDYDDVMFGISMYWEESEVAEPIDPGTSSDAWSELPVTTGSPVNPNMEWGRVVGMTIDGDEISFDIDYLGTVYPINSFTVDGDIDFISKSNDILYYTDPSSGDRMLYFNFGETLDSAILAGSTLSSVDVWKGEALWNLTLNEIKVTDVLTVYNYIPEVDNDGNVYSYFYMPNVPMDDLISVSAVLAYRYWDDGFLGVGDLEPGETQYKTVAAVRGETTSVSPEWVETAYKTAAIAGTLVTVGAVTGVVAPVYGWPIAAGFFITAGIIYASDVNEWFAYDIAQIQHVIPSIALTNEINSYISETSSDDQFNSDTDKLYKLHLAVLDESNDVQIMSDLSNITQVVWETNGQIYVVNEDNINNVEWGGPSTFIPTNRIGNGDTDTILYIVIGIATILVITTFKLDKKPGLALILLGTGVYILYRMGML